MARWREIGSSNIGCIFSFVLLLFVVFVGIRVVPTRIAVAELQDFCERQAERASLPHYSDEDIAASILEKAKENDLPVKKEDIKVWRDAGFVKILVKYHVVFDIGVYKYDWPVEHKVERILF
ncbi:MAG: hypothetical protein B7Z68_10620 [Acidobacteria bacterium 21-70-11]|nr:MAG: hypothetical protein B7Z68_10620 [Acidobacteria bacterium 21-70-11]OYW02412.1 MAG: hypothetical protein B7Z61_11640 [Acidobacteria bacterium 37-71-11]HQT95007.1 hypothetical protein [Thermoanaerobaculaceae bacterium]